MTCAKPVNVAPPCDMDGIECGLLHLPAILPCVGGTRSPPPVSRNGASVDPRGARDVARPARAALAESKQRPRRMRQQTATNAGMVVLVVPSSRNSFDQDEMRRRSACDDLPGRGDTDQQPAASTRRVVPRLYSKLCAQQRHQTTPMLLATTIERPKFGMINKPSPGDSTARPEARSARTRIGHPDPAGRRPGCRRVKSPSLPPRTRCSRFSSWCCRRCGGMIFRRKDGCGVTGSTHHRISHVAGDTMAIMHSVGKQALRAGVIIGRSKQRRGEKPGCSGFAQPSSICLVLPWIAIAQTTRPPRHTAAHHLPSTS